MASIEELRNGVRNIQADLQDEINIAFGKANSRFAELTQAFIGDGVELLDRDRCEPAEYRTSKY